MAPTDATEKGDSITELTDYCLVIPNGTKHSQQEKGYGNCLVIPMVIPMVIPNGTKHSQQKKDTVNGVKVIKLMLSKW